MKRDCVSDSNVPARELNHFHPEREFLLAPGEIQPAFVDESRLCRDSIAP